MNWLRSIFKPRKEESHEEVPMEDLLDWFLERSDTVMDSIRQDIKGKLAQLEEGIETVNDALDTLTEARLQNESISQKARAVMEGNREAYVKFVRMFVNTLAVPRDVTYESMQSFISAFEDRLDSMHKSTAKSFYVLQEFFAHESAEVARHLKRVDSVIRSLLDNDFAKTLALKRRIKEVDALRKGRKDLAKGVFDLEQEAKVTKSLIQDTQEQVKRLKQSAAWWDLDKMLKEQQTLVQKLKSQQALLNSRVAAIDRILRKYAWLVPEHKELVDRYLESPLPALLADAGLDIVMMARRMEQLVQDGQIEVKDKEKALRKLREFDQESLKEFLALHQAHKESLEEVERRIRVNGAMRQAEELEYKLAHLRGKLDKTEENREKLEKQHTKMDLEKAKDAIAAEIQEVLGVQVTIV